MQRLTSLEISTAWPSQGVRVCPSTLVSARLNITGIGGCLSVGSNAAKSLAAALGKPLVGVHHMASYFVDPVTASHLHHSKLTR